MCHGATPILTVLGMKGNESLCLCQCVWIADTSFFPLVIEIWYSFHKSYYISLYIQYYGYTTIDLNLKVRSVCIYMCVLLVCIYAYTCTPGCVYAYIYGSWHHNNFAITITLWRQISDVLYNFWMTAWWANMAESASRNFVIYNSWFVTLEPFYCEYIYLSAPDLLLFWNIWVCIHICIHVGMQVFIYMPILNTAIFKFDYCWLSFFPVNIFFFSSKNSIFNPLTI